MQVESVKKTATIGSFVVEMWIRHTETNDRIKMISGELHRDLGPAHIVYAEDGSVESEGWYRDGVKHQPSAHEILRWASVKGGAE